MTAITPLGQKIAQCYSHPPVGIETGHNVNKNMKNY